MATVANLKVEHELHHPIDSRDLRSAGKYDTKCVEGYTRMVSPFDLVYP